MAVRNLGFFAFAFLMISMAAAREVPAQRSLEARLRVGVMAEADDGSGMVDCWGSLLELRSCTNEVVLFFLNGEGYIGHDCCRAIRIITHQCWPNMLTSIGFTSEEGDVLRDYCDIGAAGQTPHVAVAPVPSPNPAPAPGTTTV